MYEAKILVAEDEPSIAEVVKLYLNRAGYLVTISVTGDDVIKKFQQEQPDLLILDLMLPTLDGMTIMRWLRDRSDVPVIILTSRRSETDRVAGLEMGADDYVVKPFSPQELVSRVRAVLRRTRAGVSGNVEDALSVSGIAINPTTRVVTVHGRDVSLTTKEFDMLFLLAQNPKRVFSRQQLLELIWGVSDYIDPGTVTVHIRRLREKIEENPSNPVFIQTVWGIGYKFDPVFE